MRLNSEVLSLINGSHTLRVYFENGAEGVVTERILKRYHLPEEKDLSQNRSLKPRFLNMSLLNSGLRQGRTLGVQIYEYNYTWGCEHG